MAVAQYRQHIKHLLSQRAERVRAQRHWPEYYANHVLRTGMAYVYILECADGSFYTGSDRHLEKRLHQHQQGEGARHTAARLPVKRVYWEAWPHIGAAVAGEVKGQLITGAIDCDRAIITYLDQSVEPPRVGKFPP